MSRRNVIVDSDESDADSDISPSPKRKRGRPPKAKNKKQRIQDDSDDDSLTSVQNGRVTSSQDSDDESGSDYTPATAPRPTRIQRKTTQTKAGRPVRAVKRAVTAVTSDDSDSGFPQPSTSHATNDTAEVDSESESSGSETPDSDYGPIDRVSSPKKKVKKKGGKPKNAKQQKLRNGVVSSVSSSNNSRNSSKKNAKLSQSTSNAVFDATIVENLAQKLVYFLLIEDQRKYAIKRKAIVASVFKDENYSPKLYLAVINKANSLLKKTYGMELMELENQKDSYLIVNIMRRELGIHDFVDISRLKQQQNGLILYIVTVIFMNDNVITEEELTKSLKVLGIDLTSKKVHPIFGDVKKYITTEMVKMMYLEYKRVSKEPLRHEFTWGLRAKQEFDKTDLLQYACEIMDDTAPEDWRIQYKDAEKSSKSS